MHHTMVYVMHFVVLEHPCKDAICELDSVSAISGAEIALTESKSSIHPSRPTNH